LCSDVLDVELPLNQLLFVGRRSKRLSNAVAFGSQILSGIRQAAGVSGVNQNAVSEAASTLSFEVVSKRVWRLIFLIVLIAYVWAAWRAIL
tara:strand:- start:95 stop:367 length:273 start_codon:yes stop_codon:yes gene_type:complete